MRYLIFSDIHGNLEALRAVLESIKKSKIDYYLFLGDIVGYGASPNEVIKEVSALKPITTIRGNHDKAVSNLEAIKTFNPIAAAAVYWTRDCLNKKHADFLKKLKKGSYIVNEEISICHGAPFDEDFYIFGEFDAQEAFLHFKTPLCFFGHTHFPFVYVEKNHLVEGIYPSGETFEIKIEDKVRYLINPGSIGQPRDRNNRASCVIFDTETRLLKFFRFDYDIKEAQRKILAEDLPKALAERLDLGI